MTDKKREDYLPWDDYFMGIAFLSAMRSKDPSTQSGACIVNADNVIVGTGYNGFPMGISDDDLTWGRDSENPLETKYPFVAHAEENAICNSNQANLKGCRIYATLHPCNKCAIHIIQKGIVEVIYLSDKYRDTPVTKASKLMLELAGIKTRQFVPKFGKILLDIEEFQSKEGSISPTWNGPSL